MPKALSNDSRVPNRRTTNKTRVMLEYSLRYTCLFASPGQGERWLVSPAQVSFQGSRRVIVLGLEDFRFSCGLSSRMAQVLEFVPCPVHLASCFVQDVLMPPVPSAAAPLVDLMAR